MIKFKAEGSKEVFRAKEITKKTFEFWKDKPDELSDHVNGGGADEDVEIGIYDEIEDFTVIGWKLDKTTLEIEEPKESILFELSEENFKKNKINFKITKKNFKDVCENKKGFIFNAYERLDGTCGPVEIEKVKKFDKTKLKITVTQLVLPDSSEIKAITVISYDKQDISWDLIESNVEATGDLPNLEVNKI